MAARDRHMQVTYCRCGVGPNDRDPVLWTVASLFYRISLGVLGGLSHSVL